MTSENARARLCKLEELLQLQDRLLAQAGERIEQLERRLAHLERPPAPPDPPRRIPIAEGSRRSGLSVKTIKRLIKRGAVKGHAVRATGAQRRRWLVDVASLEAFLSTPVDVQDGNASEHASRYARVGT